MLDKPQSLPEETRGVASQPTGGASPADFSPWRCGLIVYLVSLAIVLTGAFVGLELLAPGRPSLSPRRIPECGVPLLDALSRWDGQWYGYIVQEGYTYDSARQSSVAFFPLYPLLGWVLGKATGLGPALALLLVAHAFLIGFCILLAKYVRQRYPQSRKALTVFVLLAFALYPVTFFARMAYTESLFLFLSILALYAMERKWSLGVIVPVIALATATRTVGIALLAPFLLHLWSGRKSVWQAIGKAAWLTPLAVSGLALFVLFLWIRFDEPLAFAKAQRNWRKRPDASVVDKAIALASLEPIWATYDETDRVSYWRRPGEPTCPALNPRFVNPLYLMLAFALIILGEIMGWLSLNETLFGLTVLAIPYLSCAFENCMLSQARFSTVAPPIYLVMGQILVRLPWPAAALILAANAALLGIYSAMFAAHYYFV
jgi:hypothetical protein